MSCTAAVAAVAAVLVLLLPLPLLLLLLLLLLVVVVVLLHLPVVVLAAVVKSLLPKRRRERVRVGDSVLVVEGLVAEDVTDSVLVLNVEVEIVAMADAMWLTVARVAAGQELPAGWVRRAAAFAARAPTGPLALWQRRGQCMPLRSGAGSGSAIV